jgi:hypothetical protein
MDQNINIFEQASRLALRFDSPKGKLSVEDLWNLPLQSTNKDKANLDDIAIALNEQNKTAAQTLSFVSPTTSSKENAEVSLKFEIVKYIIGVKVRERDIAAQEKERAEKKQELLAALERAENRALDAKSPEELRAMIAAM